MIDTEINQPRFEIDMIFNMMTFYLIEPEGTRYGVESAPKMYDSLCIQAHYILTGIVYNWDISYPVDP